MFVKGADNKILERLTRDGSGYSRFEEETKVHLDMFSEDGLRTLAVGYKVIDPNEWAQVFGPRLQNIQNLLEGRDVAVCTCFHSPNPFLVRDFGLTLFRNRFYIG